MPRGDALMLILIRYPQEIVPAEEYAFPKGSLASYKLGKRELDMARQLVSTMSGKWEPSKYRDEFRAKLSKAIEARMKKKGVHVEKPAEEAHEGDDKVVDLMAVLRRSLDARKGAKSAPAPKARSRKRA